MVAPPSGFVPVANGPGVPKPPPIRAAGYPFVPSSSPTSRSLRRAISV